MKRALATLTGISVVLVCGPSSSARAEKPILFQTWSTESLTEATSLRVWAASDNSAITLGLRSKERPEEKRLTPDQVLAISQTPRRVLNFELKDLRPGGRYKVQLYQNGKAIGARRTFFVPRKALPFCAVVGGDLGIYPETLALLKLAAQQEPDVLLIGGDVAYADGNPRGYARWDRMLTFFDEAFRTSGRVAPLLVAVGNHEVQGYFDAHTFAKAPFYRALFLPATPEKPKSYALRTVGKQIAWYLLDTMHVVRHGGAQANWLSEKLQQTQQHRWKFAVYHIPLYPSVRDPQAVYSSEGRKHWVPLFDKFMMTAAFENHDHGLKRTYRLRDNKKHPKGTLYLGDGTFGVPARPVKKQPYLKKAASTQHFWRVDVSESRVRYRAIDLSGRVVDEATTP